MKKLIGSLFCGLLVAQAASTYTFNFRQPIDSIKITWQAMNPTYKKWFKIAGWTAVAAGSIGLTAYGISLLDEVGKLSKQAEAIDNKLMSEFIERCIIAQKTLIEAENKLPQEEYNALEQKICQQVRTDALSTGERHHEMNKLNNKIAFNVFTASGFVLGSIFYLLPKSLINIYETLYGTYYSSDSQSYSTSDENI